MEEHRVGRTGCSCANLIWDREARVKLCEFCGQVWHAKSEQIEILGMKFHPSHLEAPIKLTVEHFKGWDPTVKLRRCVPKVTQIEVSRMWVTDIHVGKGNEEEGAKAQKTEGPEVVVELTRPSCFSWGSGPTLPLRIFGLSARRTMWYHTMTTQVRFENQGLSDLDLQTILTIPGTKTKPSDGATTDEDEDEKWRRWGLAEEPQWMVLDLGSS